MRVSVATRNSQCVVVSAALVHGFIRLYDGAMPASPETALGAGNRLLAELRFDATAAFGAPSNGAMIANAITEDSSADAGGIVAWGRCYQSDGATAVLDVSVSLDQAAGDIQLNRVAVDAGDIVRILSFTYSLPA